MAVFGGRDRSAGVVLVGGVALALPPVREGLGQHSRHAFSPGIRESGLGPSGKAFLLSSDADIIAEGRHFLVTGFVGCSYSRNAWEESLTREEDRRYCEIR
jgi:hypothetical protein